MLFDYQSVPVDGERLTLERKRRKLTQEELAEAAGISKRQIQKMERGDAATLRASIKPVARVLGINWQYFVQKHPGWPSKDCFPCLDLDNVVFIVGLRTDKDFDGLSESENVLPIITLLEDLHVGGLEGCLISYVGMTPLTSALLEFELDAYLIWRGLIKLLSEDKLRAYEITDIYLPPSYVAYWEEKRATIDVPTFEDMLRHEYGDSISFSTLPDNTVVLTHRDPQLLKIRTA